MVEKLRKNPDSVFELPTLKSIITEIEEKNSEDGKPVYQNQVVESYTQQKQFLRNAVSMVQSLVDCFTGRYKCKELNSNDESTYGDSILINVCRKSQLDIEILNWNITFVKNQHQIIF